MTRTTLRDFLRMDIDIDVHDDTTEDLYIAYVGPHKLTDAGKDVFKDILSLEVDIYDEIATVIIPEGKGWRMILDNVCHLFHAAAGFCTDLEYAAIFEEADDDH